MDGTDLPDTSKKDNISIHQLTGLDAILDWTAWY